MKIPLVIRSISNQSYQSLTQCTHQLKMKIQSQFPLGNKAVAKKIQKEEIKVIEGDSKIASEKDNN